jgi:hypothetical protein
MEPQKGSRIWIDPNKLTKVNASCVAFYFPDDGAVGGLFMTDRGEGYHDGGDHHDGGYPVRALCPMVWAVEGALGEVLSERCSRRGALGIIAMASSF